MADGKKILYCDMDGVLADFMGADGAVERFRVERGFFFNLAPFEKNIQAIKIAIADGIQVYILSASPNKRADGDKIKWLKKYLPEIADGNIILMRNGKKKVDYMLSADGILFDDYGVNLQEWADGNPNNECFKVRADGDIAIGLNIFYGI